MKRQSKSLSFFTFFIMVTVASGFTLPIYAPVVGPSPTNGKIGFMPNQIPTLSVSYSNGIWSFGPKVNVSISFLSGGVRSPLSTFSKVSVNANVKFNSILVRETDKIHYGLNITNLPLVVANALDDIRFKIDTSEKIEYSWDIDPLTNANVSDFSIPTLNLAFRFDDLQQAGFDLNISSDLGISVLKVKGKTSLLLDPITYSAPTITVTGFTAAVPCAFWDVWNASNVNGWGVVWNNNNTNTQYEFDCKLCIGDGTTGTFLNDTGKQAYFAITTAVVYITLKKNTTTTFGTLDDSVKKTSHNGCHFIFAASGWSYPIQVYAGDSTAKLYLFSSVLESPNVVSGGTAPYIEDNSGLAVVFVYNSILDRAALKGMGSASDLYNLQITNGYYGLNSLSASTNIAYIFGCRYAVYGYQNVGDIMTNFAVRNCITKFFLQDGGSGSRHLVNFDVDSWSFTWNNNPTNKIYRQYTLDLRVTYPNDTSFMNANVTLYDVYSTVVFSQLTNSSGQLATQTVSRGFYNATGGNTMYDYAPFTLNITSSYGNYTKIYTFTSKTYWDIALVATVIASSSSSNTGLVVGVAGFIIGLTISLAFGVRRRKNPKVEDTE